MSGYQASFSKLDFCLIDIRADASAASQISQVLQLPLPEATGFATESNDCRLLQLSPDRWLYASPKPRDAERASELNRHFADSHANATLVTDQYCGFKIQGDEVLDVLTQGCAIDLSTDKFYYGHCASIGFARIRGVLVPLAEKNSYLLLVESSLEGYFSDWLEQAIHR